MFPKYNYKYRDVTWTELTDLILAIREDTHHSVTFSEIRPFRKRPAFDDEWGPKPAKFESIFKKHQREIRKFSLTLSRNNRPSKVSSRIDLTFRIKENADQIEQTYNYPSIELLNFDGRDYDFENVRRLLEKRLSLEFSERQIRDDLIMRYKASIGHSELRGRIDAAMQSHQYDLALSGAAILVESSLRDACLKHGCSAAVTATGADLSVLAFHSSQGCLIPPYPIATQANHGAFLLFQGFFLYIRNAYMHNSKVMGDDKKYVIEFLAICDSLLTIISGSTKR